MKIHEYQAKEILQKNNMTKIKQEENPTFLEKMINFLKEKISGK